MPKPRYKWLSLPGLLSIGMLGHAASRGPCTDRITAQIPQRPADAESGRQFAARISGLAGAEREALVAAELLRGNLPDFLRHFWPVHLHAQEGAAPGPDIVICVAPDYLAIGSDSDFMLMPVRLQTALQAAANFGLALPTPRIVDAIYAQARLHLAPEPLPAGEHMRTTAYFVHHDALIAAQRSTAGDFPGVIIAGHKKDLVLTARLWNEPDRVAIYGWQRLDGAPIQPVSLVHGWRYVDYSHGARFIAQEVYVDGRPRQLWDLLQDPGMARALSGEGAIADPRALVARLQAPLEIETPRTP